MLKSKLISQFNDLRAIAARYFLATFCLCFVLGVLIAALWDIPTVYLLPCIILGLICFVRGLARRRFLSLLPAVLLLGMVWCGLYCANLSAFPLPDGHAVTMSGRVVEVLEGYDNYLTQLTADGMPETDVGTTFVIKGETTTGWRGKVMISADGYDVQVGDQLELTAIVRERSTLQNWYINNSENYLRNQGVGAYAQAVSGEVSFLQLGDENPLRRQASRAKEGIYDALAELPSIQQSLIKGIAFGDKSTLSPYERQVLSQTGVMHAFAVSGLHIGFVIMFLLAITSLLAKLLRRWFRVPNLVILAIVVLGTVFYGLIAGFSPSVTRAAIMGIAAVFAKLWGESYNSRAALIYAAFLCVLVNPLIIFDVGFQLTFLATAGIVFTMGIWKFLVKLDFIAITLSAQMLVLPMVAYYFSIITVVGLLLSPIISMIAGIVVIMALISMLLLPIGLASLPLWGAGLLAELGYKLCACASEWSWGWLAVCRPELIFVLLYYVLLLTAYALFAKAQSIHSATLSGSEELTG